MKESDNKRTLSSLEKVTIIRDYGPFGTIQKVERPESDEEASQISVATEEEALN